MPEPEPTEEEILAQAAACPLIRSAYASRDPEVIRYVEEIHPLSRCQHVKVAAEKVRRA
jgi:hypothetical protein